jgi:hypothetical protein
MFTGNRTMNVNTKGTKPVGNRTHLLEKRHGLRGPTAGGAGVARDRSRASGVSYEEESHNEDLHQTPGGPSAEQPNALDEKAPCPVCRTLRFLVETVKQMHKDHPADNG